MKKIFILMLFIVSGCVEQEAPQSERPITEKVRNEKCADIQKYKVFQVINDGALATACDAEYGVETCYGLVAYIPKGKGKIYYDEMIVEPADNQCIAYNGVYKYQAKTGVNKTVPKIKFIAD